MSLWTMSHQQSYSVLVIRSFRGSVSYVIMGHVSLAILSLFFCDQITGLINTPYGHFENLDLKMLSL